MAVWVWVALCGPMQPLILSEDQEVPDVGSSLEVSALLLEN